MNKKDLNILRNIRKNLKKPINMFKIMPIVKEKTYYPEKKRKKIIQRIVDNITWVWKNGEINTFYNLYGFDIKKFKEEKDYISYIDFMYTRNDKNRIDEKYNYIVILRDKYLFERYMNSNNIKTAKTIAVIKNGKILDVNLERTIDEKDIFNKIVFIKNVDGECADGVYCIKNIKHYNENKHNFEKGFFIVQEKLIQDKAMSMLNAESVNTIRIVTIRENNKIKILSSVLRVGTTKSKNVDNWAAGGLCIEICKNGILTQYGFAKPKYGDKFEIHPDSKVKFKGFKIPYYNEVENLVKKAHEKLYGIDSIGWDVAITQDGPVLIEGNDNWEISLMQINKGLKKEWKEFIER